jgi:hypothetical protein
MVNKRSDRRLPGVLSFLLLAAIVLGYVPGRADTGPQPPCGKTASPSYPDVDQPPVVRVWENAALGRDWAPPSCTGWTTSGFTTLVVTVGRFRHAGGTEGLLRRAGAISERAGIRYWTTTHKRWQTLITGACALQGPVDDRCRKDFSPDEMAEGNPLYFRQEDNLFGEVIYRMRIRSASPGRLVFEAENAGSVRNLLVPLFHPGEIQSLYFLERESPDVWRYYGILRTGKGASPLTAGHGASYANRAVAFYRFLAGIPTDQEPPAAP